MCMEMYESAVLNAQFRLKLIFRTINTPATIVVLTQSLALSSDCRTGSVDGAEQTTTFASETHNAARFLSYDLTRNRGKKLKKKLPLRRWRCRPMPEEWKEGEGSFWGGSS